MREFMKENYLNSNMLLNRFNGFLSVKGITTTQNIQNFVFGESEVRVMAYLKKNIDYLAECLSIVSAELDLVDVKEIL